MFLFLTLVFLLLFEQAEGDHFFFVFFSVMDFNTACSHNLHLQFEGHISVSRLQKLFSNATKIKVQLSFLQKKNISGVKYVQCFKSHQIENRYLNCHVAFLCLAQLQQSNCWKQQQQQHDFLQSCNSDDKSEQSGRLQSLRIKLAGIFFFFHKSCFCPIIFRISQRKVCFHQDCIEHWVLRLYKLVDLKSGFFTEF